jgi:hypothetical protein
MPTTDRLLSLRRQETGKLPPWDTIIRGTLLRYRLTCGKPTCRCHRSKQYRHVPYVNSFPPVISFRRAFREAERIL